MLIKKHEIRPIHKRPSTRYHVIHCGEGDRGKLIPLPVGHGRLPEPHLVSEVKEAAYQTFCEILVPYTGNGALRELIRS